LASVASRGLHFSSFRRSSNSQKTSRYTPPRRANEHENQRPHRHGALDPQRNARTEENNRSSSRKILATYFPSPRRGGEDSFYSKRAGWAHALSGSRKLLKPTPTKRKSCFEPRSTRSRSDKAMLVGSSQEEGRAYGVWLRVRILNSLVFSLGTTVRATRNSLRDVAQVSSARRRIIGSISASGTSCSKVSSTDTDFVGRSEMTSLSSIPRASS